MPLIVGYTICSVIGVLWILPKHEIHVAGYKFNVLSSYVACGAKKEQCVSLGVNSESLSWR